MDSVIDHPLNQTQQSVFLNGIEIQIDHLLE
jgi:hypothetical protein